MNERAGSSQAFEPSPTSTKLTDLPPELWNQIVSYLPTASSISHLSQTNKSLAAFVERDGWKTFSRHRFPSLYPTKAPPDEAHRSLARSLTTLSRAFDRREIVAKYTEPSGEIYTFPGAKRQDRWQRPRGQTIGFTPQLDVYDEVYSQTTSKETLAYSAGAEICVRFTNRDRRNGSVRWLTYRPPSAREGLDDITALHLIPPGTNLGVDCPDTEIRLLKGTAKGDLQLLRLPADGGGPDDASINYFTTQGAPVRSTSVYHSELNHSSLLAANLGDSRLAIYNIDVSQVKIAPTSQVDIKPTPATNGATSPSAQGPTTLRTWRTSFLSSSKLAVGVGPSTSPIRIYTVNQSGLSEQPLREMTLSEDNSRALDDRQSTASVPKKLLSSVYTIVPLPPSAAASSADGNVFLSGAYDGVIRLHDLRSARDHEQQYIDPNNDNPIYSLLPRGREKVLAGTSRHNLLKVFDLRLGARCYNYLHARTDTQDTSIHQPSPDFNLFLRPHTNKSRSRRQTDSSVYTLASATASSPFIYAGVENNAMSLAMTSLVDQYPDSAFFVRETSRKDILRLSMYEQNSNMRLMIQRDLRQERAPNNDGSGSRYTLDASWIDASEMRGGRWQRGIA